jgi:hypothetical protein
MGVLAVLPNPLKVGGLLPMRSWAWAGLKQAMHTENKHAEKKRSLVIVAKSTETGFVLAQLLVA